MEQVAGQFDGILARQVHRDASNVQWNDRVRLLGRHLRGGPSSAARSTRGRWPASGIRGRPTG